MGPKGGVGLPGITGGDGPAGRNGIQGQRGEPGVCKDSHCADGSPLSWNQCVFNRLNNQKDYGLLAVSTPTQCCALIGLQYFNIHSQPKQPCKSWSAPCMTMAPCWLQ